MAMLHDDMNLDRHKVYAHLIEESNLRRLSRNLKRSVDSDQVQPTFKNGVQTQDGPSVDKMKFEKRGGSSNGEPTCATC